MDVFLLGLGIVGTGYWINQSPKNPRNYQVREKLSENEEPVGDHIYHSDEIKKQTERLQQMLNENYEKSKEPDSNYVNPILLNTGRDLSPQSNEDRIPLEKNKVVSTLTGQPMEMFHSNLLPYHSSSNTGENGLNYSSWARVDIDSLSQEYSTDLKPKHKKEIETLFKPVNQEPYKKLDSVIQKFRIEESFSQIQNGFNPFEEEKEIPLLTTGTVSFGDQINNFRFDPKTIDELRVKDRPVLKNQIQMGSLETSRGDVGEFSQNKSDTFYEPNNQGNVSLSFAGSRPKQNCEIILPNPRIHGQDYKGPSSFTALGSTNRSKMSKTEIKKLTFPSQLRNLQHQNAQTQIPNIKETFDNVPTNRDQQGDQTYTPIASDPNKGKALFLPKELRNNKQLIESSNHTQIRSSVPGTGSYTETQNFQAKYTNKEFNINNNYLPPAEGITQKGAYEESKPQNDKRQTPLSDYTPNAGSSRFFHGVNDAGNIRQNTKNSLVRDHINSGMLDSGDRVSSDHRLANKRTANMDRLGDASEMLKCDHPYAPGRFDKRVK